jgi:hypothetical protein
LRIGKDRTARYRSAGAGGGWSATPRQTEYVWPSKPDLMGRLTGFKLRDRWAG